MSLSFSLKLVLVFLSLSGVAQAGTFSSVVVYGDSLSDNGNLFAATGQPGVPYYQGRRSDGPVAVEQLAAVLGTPLLDFAWIGATTGIGNYADGGTPTTLGTYGLPGMQAEFAATQASLGPYLASGLFIVWGGPNDFLSPSPLDPTPLAIISRAVGDELGIVASLELLGAHNILVPGMPDLGLTPYFQSLGPAAAAQGSAITDAYNAALRSNLPSGVLFYDTAALLRSIVDNPGAYGFTNATDPCFDGTTVCANPSQYVFFDSFHPTTTADVFVANGFLETVTPEPSTFAVILGGLALCAALRLGGKRGIFLQCQVTAGHYHQEHGEHLAVAQVVFEDALRHGR
jgi:phospholipase/lecithinase/hemolysin